MIAAPPSDDGAVHATSADPLPGCTWTPVGAPGSVRGVIVADGLDGLPAPTALAAETVNVYPVPLASPMTVQLVMNDGAMHVAPPGVALAAYPVSGEPPSLLGADQETVTDPSPGRPVTFWGCAGTPRTTTDGDGLDGAPVPDALVAVTVNVYVWPFVRPVMVQV